MKCKCGGSLRKRSKKPGGIDVYRCKNCHRKWIIKDGKPKEMA